MTPEERRLFIEFLNSIQSIQALKGYIVDISNDNSPDVVKLAQIVENGKYLETLNLNDDKKSQESYNELGKVPLASSGGNANELIDYLKNRWRIELRPEVATFVKNNYEKITPKLILEEEKFLQNKYIEELQLKTGLTKKQAKQFEVYKDAQNNQEAIDALYNEVASALCQHPEIKKLELEKMEELDEHARQVVTKVIADIKSGKDESGLFFPYVETDLFQVFTVELVVGEWNVGYMRPLDVNFTKVTREDINKELLEGIHLVDRLSGEDVFVKKTEEDLKAEELKWAELEKGEELAEEKARDLIVNRKALSAEIPFNTEEDDITFYQECFDPNIVPGLADKLSGTKIGELDIAQYYKFEKEVLDMVNSSASEDKMSYDEYDLGSIRHLLRYAAAKQDGMLLKGEEYQIDDAKTNKSKAENTKYIEELDKLVKQSELFKSHLADPVPTYEPIDGSYLKTFKENEKRYANKLNNSFDNLPEEERKELLQEAEKLSKDHPYIDKTDIIKYFIHQEVEILRAYHACVDPEDKFTVLKDRNAAPFTLEAIGRGIGVKAKAYELKQAESPFARSKEEQESQARQNLNLSDENFRLYKSADTATALWREISEDVTISENLADLAASFENSHFDVSDPQFLKLLSRYNKETDQFEPLPLSVQEPTRDGMVRFLTELDALVKPGDEVFDFNILSNGRGSARSFAKKAKADREWYDTSAWRINAKTKPDPDRKARMEAIQKVFAQPDVKSRLDELTARYTVYRQVTDEITRNKTGAEKLGERSLKEKKDAEILELAAGRSDKQIGRHENYRLLAETPLKKSDVLPMGGLALLVSNSLKLNKNISDTSTQIYQTKAKPGVELTQKEQEYFDLMTVVTNQVNIGTKIIETALGGSDIDRMGSRCKAVVEGRKQLNLAAEEYEKGNKQPLIELLKDSIPVALEHGKDVGNHISDGSGKALSEMSDAIETLFANDPEMKEAVGIPEEKLNKMHAMSNFIKRVAYPVQRQKESFAKNMIRGSENKDAYVREMLFNSFLVSKLCKEVRDENNRIQELSSGFLVAETEKNLPKVVLEVNGVVMDERSTVSALRQGILSVFKYENAKWPEIYSNYEKEPIDETPLLEEFENSVVNTPEYKKLLTQDADRLANTNFDEELSEIYVVNWKRKQEKKGELQAQKDAEIKKAEAIRKADKKQITLFAGEIVRLSGRIEDTHNEKKQKNSTSYKALRNTLSDFKSKVKEIKTEKDLKEKINDLNESVNDYLEEHANEKKAFSRHAEKPAGNVSKPVHVLKQ